jgi:uncharacterized membrane protein YbhN (UPF0104 family)
MTTSFANVQYPVEHAGVQRVERAAATFKDIARSFDGARATASLLLAAIVSALLVVANQVVETWTEGHLLAAWIVLWTVAFAALALLATPARRAGRALRSGLKAAKARRIQARHDRQYWEAALTDARIMADISRAMSAAAVQDIKRYY